MSWNLSLEPELPDAIGMDSIETLIVPRAVDVNRFIRRVLPAPQRQMVGPFIFFDQFGPIEAIIEAKFGVRPHPHIGLATVTYLYRGEVHHRDSLGTSQIIAPGDVNWMVAGRGITHSERPPAEQVGKLGSGYGIQTWVALPESEEDAPPRFEHHPQRSPACHRGRGPQGPVDSRQGVRRGRAGQRLLRDVLWRRIAAARRSPAHARRS